MKTFFYLLSSILVSISLIIGFHYGWEYIQGMFSVRKPKDLVNNQLQKYKKLVEEMQQEKLLVGKSISDLDKEELKTDLLKFASSL